MKSKNLKNNTEAVLTERMNVNDKEYYQAQALLLNKVRTRSDSRKLRIELLANKYEIEDYVKSTQSDQIQVGNFINKLLSTFKLRQNHVASHLNVSRSSFNKVINGERELNHELALKLGKLFSVNPMLLLDIQDKNKLDTLKLEKENELKEYSLKDLIGG